MVGRTVTPGGVGGLEALRIFSDVLAPACISTDHPRHLSFVPAAPTEASILFDLVVGASSIYAGSWVEGAGAVFAENEALRWIADLAGLPPEAGGVFVSGGTAGNLSALLAARWKWRADAGGAFDRTRGLIIGCAGAHSSVAQAAKAMDADIVLAPADERGRLTADAIDATIDGLDRGRPAAGVRRRRHVRHDERRGRRRPRGRRRRSRTARHVVPRRRRLRRRRARRPERAPPVRRGRAGRQLHRRSAQVAVRPVRLVRPRVPRSGDRPPRPHPARRVPRRAPRRSRPRQRGGGLEHLGLRPPPHPPGARACRSGSAWRPTAPTPMRRRSRRRCGPPAPAPASSTRPTTSS